MNATKGTLARWQTIELHTKENVTYKRQHVETDRTSNEKQDKYQFEY